MNTLAVIIALMNQLDTLSAVRVMGVFLPADDDGKLPKDAMPALVVQRAGATRPYEAYEETMTVRCLCYGTTHDQADGVYRALVAALSNSSHHVATIGAANYSIQTRMTAGATDAVEGPSLDNMLYRVDCTISATISEI